MISMLCYILYFIIFKYVICNKNNDDDNNARALRTSTTKITSLNATQLKKDNVLQAKAQKGQNDNKFWS
jgi:hypothetical protein